MKKNLIILLSVVSIVSLNYAQGDKPKTNTTLSAANKPSVSDTMNTPPTPVKNNIGSASIVPPVSSSNSGNVNVASQKDCAAAQDSAKARSARKELSFYYTSKKMAKMLYFYTIDNNHYEKTLINKMKKDTSISFMSCYNKAFQLNLDSAFNCDFFRNVDSIAASYDERGMGYRAPQFRGGKDSLNLWLSKNITLPAGAAPDDSDTNIRIYYFAQVDEKGKVMDIKFAKTNCKICEPVVTAALKKLPLFIPATQAGKTTKSTYILPYSYKAK